MGKEVTMESLFKLIPAGYIYSINGRDNILIRDVLSYLQYTHGPHITKEQLIDAITQEGFKNRGHVALRFENEAEPTSSRAWSRANPRVSMSKIERQRVYSKSEIFENHAKQILKHIEGLKKNIDRQVLIRDKNGLVSDEYIREYIKTTYPNIKTVDITAIIKYVVKDTIMTKMLVYNMDTPSKSRYWKIYLFVLNKKIEHPEIDAVHIMYEEVERNPKEFPTYAAILKFALKGSIYTITFRSQSLDKLKDYTEQIAHVVNEISKKESYKFRAGIYASDRYVKSSKSRALSKNLFKNEHNLFTI